MRYVKKTSADTNNHSRVGTLNPPIYKEPTLLDRVTPAGTIKLGSLYDYDEMANLYRGKLVYVWKGEKKGQVGRVVNMGILDARLSFTGTVGDTGIRSLKRVNLIRYACKVNIINEAEYMIKVRISSHC